MARERADVVVVGGGAAALQAAVAARESGARRVLLLEKAPLAESGGNTRLSHAGFRFCHDGAGEMRVFLADLPPHRWEQLVIPRYTPADFRGDLARTTAGRIDRDLADALVLGSNAAAHWLSDHGLRFEPNKPAAIGGRLHLEPGAPLQAAGGLRGGLRQLEHWRRVAAGLGIEVRTEAPVGDLVGDAARVEGVEMADGSVIAAGATILCAGGFQADPDARARYYGAAGRRALVKGSRHDTGEVLMAALRLGAARAGDWDEANVVPTAVDAPPVESGNLGNRFSYPYGITIDRSGRRFVDEGSDFRSQTLQAMGSAILARPDALAFQLFDQVGVRLLQHERYRTSQPVRAQTIEDLAHAIDVDPVRLRDTVAAFNAAVDEQVPFDPAVLDGRSTVGIDPPKSNWAMPLVEPPFVAYPVTAGILYSYGGLRIDTGARVLAEDGRPIPGLFAAGDIVGLFHGGDPSGAGQTRNTVFGRLAGEHAAAITA